VELYASKLTRLEYAEPPGARHFHFHTTAERSEIFFWAFSKASRISQHFSAGKASPAVRLWASGSSIFEVATFVRGEFVLQTTEQLAGRERLSDSCFSTTPALATIRSRRLTSGNRHLGNGSAVTSVADLGILSVGTVRLHSSQLGIVIQEPRHQT